MHKLGFLLILVGCGHLPSVDKLEISVGDKKISLENPVKEELRELRELKKKTEAKVKAKAKAVLKKPKTKVKCKQKHPIIPCKE